MARSLFDPFGSRASAPAIRRCRETFGTSRIVEALPDLRRIADAVYVPMTHGLDWGVYAQGREVSAINPESRDKRIDAFAQPTSLPAAQQGTYLYLGAMAGHFGHFVTDVIARLWPLLTWQGERPRLVYHGPPGLDQWRPHGFISVILDRFGMSIDDLVWFDEPRRIANLVLPEPCFRHGEAHRVYRDLCRHVGRPFWREEEVDREDKPVFLSKLKLGAGGLHKPENEARLVEALERRGCDIVFPEELDFPGQIALMARRRTILGMAGSALHTSLFSAPSRRIVALNFWSRVNANFPTIDRLGENRAFYYAPPEPPYVHGGDYALRWTIERPEAVADELMERARDFAAIEARDDREDAAFERRARSVVGRAESAYRTARGWMRPAASRPRRD